jgi:hypothetical protein
VSRIFTEDSARTAPHRTGRQQLRTSAQAAQLVNRIFTEASAGSESSAPARPPALRSSPRSWPAGDQDLHRGFSQNGAPPDRPSATSNICTGCPAGGRIFTRSSDGDTTGTGPAPDTSYPPWPPPEGDQDLHRGFSQNGDTPDRQPATSIICPGRPDGGRIFTRSSDGSESSVPEPNRRAPRSSPWSWPAGEQDLHRGLSRIGIIGAGPAAGTSFITQVMASW